jgi:hypothetical protein
MTAAERSRLNKLLVFMVLAAAFAVWSYRDVLGAKPASDTTAREIDVAKLSADLMELDAMPALQITRADGGDAFELRRRVFDYTESPESVAAERERREQAEAQARREMERQIKIQEEQAKLPPPEPPPPPPPQAPTFPFVYFGQVIQNEGGEQILACLQRSGGAKKDKFEWVRVGDIVDNTFVIKKIEKESLTVGYTNPTFKDMSSTIQLIKGSGGRR